MVLPEGRGEVPGGEVEGLLGEVLLKINSKIKLLFLLVGTCNAIVKEGIDLALAANKPNYGHGHLGQSLLIPTTSDLVAIFKKNYTFQCVMHLKRIAMLRISLNFWELGKVFNNNVQ